jgi:hypothetical protein
MERVVAPRAGRDTPPEDIVVIDNRYLGNVTESATGSILLAVHTNTPGRSQAALAMVGHHDAGSMSSMW